MKIVIAGGTGQIGSVLATRFRARGDHVIVLSRQVSREQDHSQWDGRSLGPWCESIDGSDVVINLAGRSVDCRYSRRNLEEMMRSRVESTEVIGQAIAAAEKPPKVWLQMSTATIYAHRFDHPNDEYTGILGGDEPDAPKKWNASIAIAKGWERALNHVQTPHTRKVAMRTAMMMGTGRGGVFHVLSRMTRFGLGGTIAGGRQYVSWIHELDFVRAVDHLIKSDHLSGAINLASPGPLPQADFMTGLRRAWGTPFGLPASRWMAEFGAFFLRTETELILKSRRVIPGRLTDDGFKFKYPAWPQAASELVSRMRWRSLGAEKGTDEFL